MFLTMELVDGESLAALLARAGALPLGARRRDRARRSAPGSSARRTRPAWSTAISSPTTSSSDTDGRVVITDFGIARAASSDGAGARDRGPRRARPRTWRRSRSRAARDVDARADLYALGVLLYELLTGERAWPGDAPLAVASARLTHPPRDPRARRAETPPALAALVAGLMARRREDRPLDASQVAEALARVAETLGASGGAASPPATTQVLHLPVGDKTVAVLSFRNGGPPEDDYLADGVTEDLIDTLSMTRGLRVLDRGERPARQQTGARRRPAGSRTRARRPGVVVDE